MFTPFSDAPAGARRHRLHGCPGLACFAAPLFILPKLLLVGAGRLHKHAGACCGTSWEHGSPEANARRILAERFANGDITKEEFLERAAVLNWTPGADTCGCGPNSGCCCSGQACGCSADKPCGCSGHSGDCCSDKR